MDQESFRRLLQTPHPNDNSTSSASRGSLFAAVDSKTKSKVVGSSNPAFKPRKVKASSQYRDRAAERRVGEGNDYAQVEAVLEAFEKQNVGQDRTAVEEQRRYLGGDGDHSILVKGLDMALLEQNKARAALNTDDDDSLEQAFLEVSSQPVVPKKRTREDLIRELKEKRASKGEVPADAQVPKTVEEEAQLLEEAKKKGKFKPIGFKPIGSSKGTEKKVKANEKGGEKKKKRRKVVENEVTKSATTEGVKADTLPESKPATPTLSQTLPAPPAAPPEPQQVPDDFDIFADVGEYEGINSGDDDDDNDDDGNERSGVDQTEGSGEGKQPSSTIVSRRWIETDDPEVPKKPDILSSVLESTPHLPIPGDKDGNEDEEGEIEQPTRLVPLESSALPSIKDFLALDSIAGGSGKRKKRKEKKGGGGNGSKGPITEAKVDRDYKRLKNYTDKKAG